IGEAVNGSTCSRQSNIGRTVAGQGFINFARKFGRGGAEYIGLHTNDGRHSRLDKSFGDAPRVRRGFFGTGPTGIDKCKARLCFAQVKCDHFLIPLPRWTRSAGLESKHWLSYSSTLPTMSDEMENVWPVFFQLVNQLLLRWPKEYFEFNRCFILEQRFLNAVDFFLCLNGRIVIVRTNYD